MVLTVDEFRDRVGSLNAAIDQLPDDLREAIANGDLFLEMAQVNSSQKFRVRVIALDGKVAWVPV